LFFWGILAAFFLTATFCFANLLRRQWIENEKFSFPLVTLPLMMAEEPEQGRIVNELFRNRLFWGGVLLTTVYHSFRGLHLWYPSIPDIPNVIQLGSYLTTLPWSNVGWFPAYFYPLVVGIAYLLPAEVCFSLWFFYLFYKWELVFAGMYNFDVRGALAAYGANQFHSLQSFGGSVGLFCWICWTARRHLRDVWLKALHGARAPHIDDSREMFSYRATVLGIAVSYTGMAVWLHAAGATVILCLLALLMLTLTLTVVSWLVSQAGMLFSQQEFGSVDVLAPTVGTAPFSASALYVTTQFETVFLYDCREMLAPSLLMGAKTVEATASEARPLFRAMVASVAIGVVVAAVVSVMLPYYNHGGDALNSWTYRDGPTRSLSFLAGVAGTPYKASWTNWLHILAGFVGVVALLGTRAQFGVGLHPIGFLVAGTYPMAALWTSILLGWVFKTVIQRYGGIHGYRAVLPLFLGLILGDVVNAVLWIVLGTITQTGYGIMPG